MKQRKRAAAAVLILALALALCACGEDQLKEIDGPVAEKYHQMMDGKDGTYYMETAVTEQFMEEGAEEEPVKSVSGEAIDGDRAVYLFGGDKLTDRQIVKGKKFINVSEESKTYFVSGYSPDEPEFDFENYKGSFETKHEGKLYRMDVYEDEYAMDSYGEDEQPSGKEVYIYIKKYVVDEQGKLAAIVYENREKGEDKSFYRRIDKVTKLQEGSVPEELFRIPGGYKKVEEGADDPMLQQ